jgi:hypothetical protein
MIDQGHDDQHQLFQVSQHDDEYVFQLHNSSQGDKKNLLKQQEFQQELENEKKPQNLKLGGRVILGAISMK